MAFIDVTRQANIANNEYCKDGYIFVKNHKNINHYSIQAMILRGCNHVNMDVKTSHKIRKTYISTLIDSGLNIDAIRRFAGHSDERTTYGNYCYNRLTNRQTEEVIEEALNVQKVIKGNQFLESKILEKSV
jgi:integrase